NVKLDNKLKNRQFKKESTDKKHRKEQKKLRAAIKDAVLKTPLPLERYKKRPGVCKDEEEEEFVESLPMDMMEEDDLEQIKAMAQKASFLTRDLSSSGPVHAKKRKGEQQGPESYEKMPRKMQLTEEKEEMFCFTVLGIDVFCVKPMSELSIFVQIKKLKELRAMLMETDPYVAVTVRKLVMVSLMEVFKDIVPSYRIRPLTETEKASKVKKETQQLREFEEGLVSQYKFYLENLEQTVKDWKQKKRKRSEAVSLQSYRGLAEVAIRCICELLVALPHFNFHNNIIVTVVPLMNDPVKRVSDMCCEAVKKLLKQDKQGHAALGTVKVISGLVKSRNYDVRPELLKVLLCLRIKEVEVKKDTDDTAPKKKFMNYKDKKKNLSRMQRKWKKAEEKLEKELLEAEASESKDKKLKLHTETLNIVFLIYFRILKKAQKSILLPSVLEGLAKFAHLINLEFFDDLLNVLQHLIQSGDLTYRESLHCIQTAFNILSGQGDVLNIDPLNFYSHLYKTLLKLNAGASNDDISIVLRCLDVMLTKRRKQVTLQRALAFVKRLSTLSLHTLPNATVGILASNRTLMHTFPKCDILLDNEAQGSGVFLPELDEPEYCNPQNTALWELHTLKRHYHPVVRRFATHLCAGAPSEGSGALIVQLVSTFPLPSSHSCLINKFKHH
uniref:Nucleolar complex protein 3 homolog n=1 Tax=Oncorhynchus kisutch TaxID=8019 RepID=A0A8C7FZY6_ONCKI